jgi:hypothetical protein
MDSLRNLSSRPEILVDNQGFRLTDLERACVGITAPLGRDRLVTALPTNGGGPVLIEPATVLCGPDLFTLADLDGNMIGEPALWVHRLLYARWVDDTRRLT